MERLQTNIGRNQQDQDMQRLQEKIYDKNNYLVYESDINFSKKRITRIYIIQIKKH